MKWSGEYRVLANDVDSNDIVSASNIFRLIQDAAYSQMEDDRPSYNELFDQGLSFVISRIRMNAYKEIYTHDKLTVQSWAAESRGVQFNRCYRIIRDGEVIVEAVSIWALFGINDGKLHRTSELEGRYRIDDMIDMPPARFKIPDDISFEYAGSRTTTYADVDLNGHMNNTRYPDILCSYSGDMNNKRVSSMCISYVSEAPLGEEIKIYRGYHDDVCYIRTIRPDGRVNVEAEIYFTETKRAK